MLIAEVSAIIKQVAAAEVLPRFRALATGEVMEKSPGDLVTIADQECERVLAGRLRELRDAPVVGEEATAADPSLLDKITSAPAAWIVDPIDGTSNFVAGNTDFAVMVALVEHGVTTHAWTWHPETDSLFAAKRGCGTTRNGVALADPPLSAEPRGILKRKYMDEPARSRLAELPDEVGALVPAWGSAGIEYAALVEGKIDFLMYWQTLPWDHAPGALLAQEAGLHVARVDGSPYVPGDGRLGLLAAQPSLWPQLASLVQDALTGI